MPPGAAQGAPGDRGEVDRHPTGDIVEPRHGSDAQRLQRDTPAPLIPQGITSANQPRSVLTLRAAPWVVTPDASLTPMAASLASPTQIPVNGGRRSAATP